MSQPAKPTSDVYSLPQIVALFSQETRPKALADPFEALCAVADAVYLQLAAEVDTSWAKRPALQTARLNQADALSRIVNSLGVEAHTRAGKAQLGAGETLEIINRAVHAILDFVNWNHFPSG